MSDKLDEADETIDIFDQVVRERDELRALLLEIEGAFLGYWTDMPDEVVEDFRVRIRKALGAYQ
jgi:hypothetical protein